MKLKELEPYLSQNKQKFLLSGTVTIELIRATFAKDASFRFKVRGFSMLPFIWDEDIITLSPFSCSAIGLGKPVAYVCPADNKLLVHRIVARKGNQYLIKGDNCFHPDCVDKKHILGCVTAIERKNRNVSFSLGPERILITFLSRSRLLSVAFLLWKLIPGPLRRFIKCRVFL